jgi:hypothetical protein
MPLYDRAAGILGHKNHLKYVQKCTLINGERSESLVSEVGLTRMVADADRGTGRQYEAKYTYVLPNDTTPFTTISDVTIGHGADIRLNTVVTMHGDYRFRVQDPAYRLAKGLADAYEEAVICMLEAASVQLGEHHDFITLDLEKLDTLRARMDALMDQVMLNAHLKGSVTPMIVGLNPSATLGQTLNPEIWTLPDKGKFVIGLEGIEGLIHVMGDGEADKISVDHMKEANLVFIYRLALACLIYGPAAVRVPEKKGKNGEYEYNPVFNSFGLDMLSTLMRLTPNFLDTMTSRLMKTIDFASEDAISPGPKMDLAEKLKSKFGLDDATLTRRQREAIEKLCAVIKCEAFKYILRPFLEKTDFKNYISPVHQVEVHIFPQLRYAGFFSGPTSNGHRLSGNKYSGIAPLTGTSNEMGALGPTGEGSIGVTWINLKNNVDAFSNQYGFSYLIPNSVSGLTVDVEKELKRNDYWNILQTFKKWEMCERLARPMVLRRDAIKVETGLVVTNLHPDDPATNYEVVGSFLEGDVVYRPHTYLEGGVPTRTIYQPHEDPLPKCGISKEALLLSCLLSRVSCLKGDAGVDLAHTEFTTPLYLTEADTGDTIEALEDKYCESDLWNWRALNSSAKFSFTTGIDMAFIDSSAAYSIMLAFAEEMRAAKDDENATDGVRDDLMKNIAAKYKSIQDEIQSLSNRRTALNQEMEASKRDLAHATAIASAESQRIKNFNNALEVVKPTKADLQTLKQLQELIMKMKDGNKFDPSKLTPAELKKFAGAESPLSRLTTNLEAYFEKSEAINREYKEAAAQISEKYKKETAFEKSSE